MPAAALREAGEIAAALSEALDYVGTLGVEFFYADGRLYVNEMAPRPHNSGHHTLDAHRVCQFEQQVRALCGLPLAVPEGTPSRSTSARSVPIRLPRSEVVHQSWS